MRGLPADFNGSFRAAMPLRRSRRVRGGILGVARGSMQGILAPAEEVGILQLFLIVGRRLTLEALRDAVAELVLLGFLQLLIDYRVQVHDCPLHERFVQDEALLRVGAGPKD